jgi:A/G-specific adenine glycosylase
MLRDGTGPLGREALEAAGPDADQVDRCIASLVEDGLLEPIGDDVFALPA